jgi:hypothetical protein
MPVKAPARVEKRSSTIKLEATTTLARQGLLVRTIYRHDESGERRWIVDPQHTPNVKVACAPATAAKPS